MTPELPEPVELVRRAVELLANRGDRAAASGVLAQLDEDVLWNQSREARHAVRGLPREPSRSTHRISRPDALAVHERNRFTCRFSRCGYAPTIDEDVLKTLGHLEVLAYYRTEPRGWHPIAWTYLTAADHLVPRSPVPTDWTTACWTCNGAKSNIRLEVLGWDHDPNPPVHTWHGLREHLPALRALVERHGRQPAANGALRRSSRPGAHDGPTSDDGGSAGAATVGRPEALRRDSSDRWTVRSFHPSSDGGRQGSLVVAARVDGTPRTSLTSREALRTYTVTGSGPYVSVDGRWRTRRVEPTDVLASTDGWSARTPWVLERYVGSDGTSENAST